jgi:hypothetical protein
VYAPAFPGLAPTDFVRSSRHDTIGFPFDAPRQLRFYRARNAIYHLFRELPSKRGRLTVVAPDYYSGNEVLALHAAGASIVYARVGRDMQLDPGDVERLCRLHDPDVLYVIHYLGWPQPIQALADLCRRRGMTLVEDCALTLLSEVDGQPVGTFGDYAIFCLYKTVPVPNGALLVENTTAPDALDRIERLKLRPAGPPSVLGRIAELLATRLRTRINGVGTIVHATKKGVGRVASALRVQRAPVGDIGFDLSQVGLAMSGVSSRLLDRLDFSAIRQRRIDNFRLLDEQVDGHATRIHRTLADGVCPMSFPILVPDKHAAATALRRRGIEAIEMWNDSVGTDASEMSQSVRFLREHLLELPVHQDLTRKHMAHIARQVSSLHLRMS